MTAMQGENASPIGRLRYCDAVLARLRVQKDTERVESLKATVAGLLREADPVEVLAEPHIIGMILELFGERGVRRIRDRSKGTP